MFTQFLPSNLTDALTLVNHQLSSFTQDTEFDSKLTLTFGNAINSETYQQLWNRPDFSIKSFIEIRPQSELNGAYGAYSRDTGKIYLSQEYLQQLPTFEEEYLQQFPPFEGGLGGINAIAFLILEEYGHLVDAEVNPVETLGDEGAIFAKLVQGENITPEELQALQNEDDTATIKLDGQTINIEQQNFVGTEGNDNITGTNEADSIRGLGGNDTLEGGEGNDNLDPGIGSDSVVGGVGSDRLVFDRRNETADVTIVYTNINQDGTITGGVNNGTTFREIESVDQLRLGSGNDNINISAITNSQNIYSGSGNDTVSGGSGRDSIRGESGNDFLVGNQGGDRLVGQDGNDTLVGVNPNDIAPGSNERDRLQGDAGADWYILADEKNIYYDDRLDNNSGNNNYADIYTFNASEDKIQLQGVASNYLLQESNGDTYLLINKLGDEPDERIAIIQEVTGLALNTNVFKYVDSDQTQTTFDIDGDGEYLAAVDGLLFYGYLNIRNLPSQNLINSLTQQLADNLINPDGNATRKSGVEISNYLESNPEMMDIDGDDEISAAIDGLLAYGYLNIRNLPSQDLVNSLTQQLADNLIPKDSDAIRTTGPEIAGFIESYIV